MAAVPSVLVGLDRQFADLEVYAVVLDGWNDQDALR